MTKLWLAIFSMVLFTVLFSTQASAGCTWVLWESTYLPHQIDDKWEIDSAYTSQAECVKKQKLLWKQMIKNYHYCGREINCKIDAEPYTVYVLFNSISPNKPYVTNEFISAIVKNEVKNNTHKFLCLPDTIDPRGSKH